MLRLVSCDVIKENVVILNTSGMEKVPKLEPPEEPVSESQSNVISLMLTKVDKDSSSEMQVEFPVDCKTELNSIPVSGSTVAAISIAASSSPLNVSQIELTDSGILLESSNGIQSALDSGAIQLEGTPGAFVQSLAVVDESDSSDGTSKFIDGQAVRFEDGSMAFLHTVPREGLQTVQFEDGTLAYLSQAQDELFNGEASGLDLDQLSSPQVHAENLDEKDVKVTSPPPVRKGNQSRSGGTTEKAFRCPYEGCLRVYTTQHHLKVHERSHTGDRPFKCTAPGCGKAFATGYGLKSHTRVHTGETPYKCAESSCCKAFKTSGDLQKHLRTHTGERPFKCPVEGCHRAFTTSNIRKVHIRTHTGERPYICDSCGRAFASATNFKNHIRIHTGEKPYVCAVPGCNKKFTEYSSLYKHNVVHTRDKPYACKLCGKHYRQTSTLAMHERTSHRNVDKNGNATTAEDKNKKIRNDKVPDALKKQIRLEFDPGTDLSDAANILIKNMQENTGFSEVPNKKLPTIIALQSDTGQLLQEHSPVYAVQLQQNGTVGSAQQILLVTDPTQLAALQQLAQVHLQNVLPSENNSEKTD